MTGYTVTKNSGMKGFVATMDLLSSNDGIHLHNCLVYLYKSLKIKNILRHEVLSDL